MVQIDISAHRIRRPEPNNARPERTRSLLESTIQTVVVVLWVSIPWAASGSGRIDPPEKGSGQRKQLSLGLDMHDGITVCLNKDGTKRPQRHDFMVEHSSSLPYQRRSVASKFR